METEADGEIGERANRAGTCITIVIQVMTRNMKHGVRGAFQSRWQLQRTGKKNKKKETKKKETDKRERFH